MRAAGLALVAATLAVTPAHAQSAREVRIPAGSAGDAAVVLARQTGSSIVIADRALARRRVPAISGRLSPREAVERLARAADAEALATGPSAWRLVPRAQRRAVRRAEPARPTPAPAELPPAPPPPEIVVTASKRDVPLRDYAGQANIVDGEELTVGGPGGTERIEARIATVTSTHLGSGRNKLFIRGIADSSFTGPTQATVGLYLGDLRLSYNAPDPDLRLTDLTSVEVLEGPQGTLYGAGSLGGIIRLVPNVPQMGVTAASAMVGASATQHGAAGADLSGMLNLPLAGDRIALRLVADGESQGGYIDKPMLDARDVNRTRILGGRAMARAQVAPEWTVDLIGVGQRTDGADSQYADRSGPPLTRRSQVVEGFDAEYAQGQLVIAGSIGDIRLRSSTGISRQRLEERFDATLPGGGPRVFTQLNDTRMIANETRAWQPLGSRWGWLAGVSFTHNRARLTRTLEITADSPIAPAAAATGVENRVEEATFYGEASVRLVQGLIATAGARWTRSQLGGQGEDVAPELVLARAAITADRSETAFLPSASLAAVLSPDTTLYFRYQESFRPGGLAIEGDFVRRFRNDRAASLEFGARHGRRGAGPFDLSASISYTDWHDIQADFIDSTGLPSTANIGDGRIWTATIGGGAALTPELRVEASFVYNHSRVDDPALASLLALSGAAFSAPVDSLARLPVEVQLRLRQVPNIARIGGRVGFDYVRSLRGDLSFSATGHARYVGESRLGVGPELGDDQGDYLDTALTLRVGRSRMGVSLTLTNLADARGNRFALGTPFTVGREQVTPLRPRTLRLGIDAAF